MGYIFATVSLLALITMPIAIICVIDRAAKRLEIGLLSVAVRGIKHSHFHISQIDICTFKLTVAILMRPSLRRMTGVMIFNLLFHVLLSYQILVPCRVVVVWEKLSQKKAHVLALGTRSSVIFASTGAICLVMLA